MCAKNSVTSCDLHVVVYQATEAVSSQHGVEGGGELGIPVADQELELIGVVAEVDEQVAGLLGDPGAGGVGGDAGVRGSRMLHMSLTSSD